jgi:hypothetical protein
MIARVEGGHIHHGATEAQRKARENGACAPGVGLGVSSGLEHTEALESAEFFLDGGGVGRRFGLALIHMPR